MNIITYLLLSLMAFMFNHRPRLNRYLRHADGCFNFSVGFQTESGNVDRAIAFQEGKARALRRTPDPCEVILVFSNRATLVEMLRITPNEMLHLILTNKMKLDGNIAYLQIFNFYISLLMGGVHNRKLRRQRAAVLERDAALAGYANDRLAEGWTPERIAGRLRPGIERGLRVVFTFSRD